MLMALIVSAIFRWKEEAIHKKNFLRQWSRGVNLHEQLDELCVVGVML
jgi:hypothetical protein